jgi:hypothetical protein
MSVIESDPIRKALDLGSYLDRERSGSAGPEWKAALTALDGLERTLEEIHAYAEPKDGFSVVARMAEDALCLVGL